MSLVRFRAPRFSGGSEIYHSELDVATQNNAVYGIYDDTSKEAVLAKSDELTGQTVQADGEYISVTNNKVSEDQKRLEAGVGFG